MNPLHTSWPRILTAALLAGAALHPALALSPPWWWVWVAPVPMLWLACTIDRQVQARVAIALAALVATSAGFGYFRVVMPMPAALAVVCGQALLWYVVTMGTRRVVRHFRRDWAMLAYPLLWVALDTLTAALLPDGNWGSLTYTQAGVLPLLQLTALAGTGGLLFVLCLPAAGMALLLVRGRGAWRPLAASACIVLAAFGFGSWHLRNEATTDATLRIGLASIDDAIGAQAAPTHWTPIRDRYDAHVAALATAGAELVLLPEKIAMRDPAGLVEWQRHYAALARRYRIWLALGIGVEQTQPRNLLWLFDPDGRLQATYEKQFPAPPERARDYAQGEAFTTAHIAATQVGLAICKDMHFARFDRAYGRIGTSAMLVPAWDFAYLDADLAERMTATRGVENGQAIVRAAREGWLSVSDAHGRIVARQRSAPMPGSTLLVDLPLPAPRPTLYTRTGDAFGWLCVAMSILLLIGTRAGRARDRHG